MARGVPLFWRVLEKIMRMQRGNVATAGILAMLLPAFLAAAPTTQPRLKLEQLMAEVSGGSGAQAWTLKYGVAPNSEERWLLADAGDDRTWFSHGCWLRLLDSRQGVVLGRWRVPGSILQLTPQGKTVQIEFENPTSRDLRFRKTVTFDPSAPKLPDEPMTSLVWLRLSRREASGPLDDTEFTRVAAEKIPAMIPVMEDAIRRDPFQPFLRAAFGRLLQAAHDERAHGLFEQAARLENVDFTELFYLSALLDKAGESQLAAETYERAYRDYLDRGYDPRLHTALISELILYGAPLGVYGQPRGSDRWDALTPAQHEEQMIRIYRLGPSLEWADLAWESRAREWERAGNVEAARAWRERSAEARKTLSPILDSHSTRALDLCLLVFVTALAALALFLIYQIFHYRAQRRLDQAQGRRAVLFGAEYWDRWERTTVLLLVLTFWIGFAFFSAFALRTLNAARTPITPFEGNWAGAGSRHFLETLPASPERDLIRALSAQQSGDFAAAEKIYRVLPDFAESWNNLGVILKQQGKEGDARQAFAKALDVDPQLNEAALNLGLGARDLWTTQYQHYFPGRPMIAVPRTENYLHAFQGGSLPSAMLLAMTHPVESLTFVQLFRGDNQSSTPILVMLILALAGLLLAISVVTVVPRRDVTLPPPNTQWIWEALVPGLGRAWGPLGIVVLLVWCYLPIQLGLFAKYGTPYVITLLSVPSLVRNYGVEPFPLSALAPANPLNPGWMQMYAAPAVLFAVNALLVLRKRFRGAGK